jgi:hypothetical protein
LEGRGNAVEGRGLGVGLDARRAIPCGRPFSPCTETVGNVARGAAL